MRLRLVVLATLGVVASVWLGGSATAAVKATAATKTTVVSGLDNPRDLAFGGDGKLYVAEAGHGGSACFTIPQQGTNCVGFTSAVSRVNIAGHSVHRVLSGLFSIAGTDGTAATGVDGVSLRGKNDLRDRDRGEPGGTAGSCARRASKPRPRSRSAG